MSLISKKLKEVAKYTHGICLLCEKPSKSNLTYATSLDNAIEIINSWGDHSDMSGLYQIVEL